VDQQIISILHFGQASESEFNLICKQNWPVL